MFGLWRSGAPAGPNARAARWLLSRSVGSLLLLLLLACGGDEPRRESARSAPLRQADLDRFAHAVLAPKATVPYPVPARTDLPASADATVLVEDDPSLAVTSGWQPQTASAVAVLLRLGPASSRHPGKRAEVVSSHDRQQTYRWLRFSGFSLEREKIGKIAIAGSFGTASSFQVALGIKEPITVPTSGDSKIDEYVIPTAGLLHWQGPLEAIQIGLPAAQEDGSSPDIEISKIDFVSQAASFPKAVGSTQVVKARDFRPSLYLHGSTRLTFARLEAPGPQRLAFGVSVLDKPLTLRVSWRGESGESRPLFEEEIADSDAWTDHAVDVPSGDGARSDLVIEALGDAHRVLFLAGPTLYRPREHPPRVILYLIDTLAAKHMSVAGYPRPTSPHFERLAADGVYFERAYSNATWTREAVADLFTSLLSVSHGLYKPLQALPEEYVTLAEVYAAAGYATAAFSTNINASPAVGTAQGFGEFFDFLEFAENPDANRTVPIPEVLEWLERHRDRPTFLYVHTAEPHFPYNPPPPFDSMFDPGYSGAMTGTDFEVFAQNREGRLPKRDFDDLVARYDGEVAFADDRFGALWTRLQEAGLLQDTIVAVTADHGEELKWKDRMGHGPSVHSSILHIPIIVWGPQRVDRGRRVAEPVQLIDIMPTLMDLSGLEAKLPLQGRTLAGYLRGRAPEEAKGRSILVTNFFRKLPQLALVEWPWKLAFSPLDQDGDRFQLFDLEHDPDEEENLFSSSPAEARPLLRRMLYDYRKLPRYRQGYAAPLEVDQDQIERLRALGYLQ
jgi:arylsulfatase A-like enzyme